MKSGHALRAATGVAGTDCSDDAYRLALDPFSISSEPRFLRSSDLAPCLQNVKVATIRLRQHFAMELDLLRMSRAQLVQSDLRVKDQMRTDNAIGTLADPPNLFKVHHSIYCG